MVVLTLSKHLIRNTPLLFVVISFGLVKYLMGRLISWRSKGNLQPLVDHFSISELVCLQSIPLCPFIMSLSTSQYTSKSKMSVEYICFPKTTIIQTAFLEEQVHSEPSGSRNLSPSLRRRTKRYRLLPSHTSLHQTQIYAKLKNSNKIIAYERSDLPKMTLFQVSGIYRLGSFNFFIIHPNPNMFSVWRRMHRVLWVN